MVDTIFLQPRLTNTSDILSVQDGVSRSLLPLLRADRWARYTDHGQHQSHACGGRYRRGRAQALHRPRNGDADDRGQPPRPRRTRDSVRPELDVPSRLDARPTRCVCLARSAYALRRRFRPLPASARHPSEGACNGPAQRRIRVVVGWLSHAPIPRLAEQLWHPVAYAIFARVVLRRCAVHRRSLAMAVDGDGDLPEPSPRSTRAFSSQAPSDPDRGYACPLYIPDDHRKPGRNECGSGGAGAGGAARCRAYNGGACAGQPERTSFGIRHGCELSFRGIAFAAVP